MAVSDGFSNRRWFSGEPGAGAVGSFIIDDPAHKIPPSVYSITGGIGVTARISGGNLVLEFDTTHTLLAEGHFTTVGTSPNFGFQDYAPVRGSVSGGTFTFKDSMISLREADGNNFGNFLDVDITPRIADGAFDGVLFKFENSAGELVDFAVDDARMIDDVTVNNMPGTRFSFTAPAGFWTGAVTNGDWQILEPIAAHHFLPSSDGQPNGAVLTYNSTTRTVYWNTPTPPQFTIAQVQDILLLLADLTIGGWEQYASGRISTNKASAYTNAQARAIADGDWTSARRGWTQASYLQDQYIAIELDEQADFTQTARWRIRFGDFNLEPQDRLTIAPADITAIGDNGLTGGDQRWYYTARWNIPAGGARLEVQKDARTALNNITIPYENITGRPVGGQNAGSASQQYIFVWRRASTTPPIPIGGARDGSGWIDLPTGWVDSPDLATGQPTDVLYFSVATDTRNSAGDHTIGAWSLPEPEGFNVQYSPVASPSSSQITATYQTSNPRSEYRRYLINGVWGPWVPMYSRTEYQQIVNYTYNVAASANRATDSRTATFPAAINLAAINEMWVELTVRRLSSPAIISRTQMIIRPHDIVAVASNSQPNVWASSRDVLSYLRIVANSSGEMRIWHGPDTPLSLADGEVNAAGILIGFIGTTAAARQLGIFRPASRNVSYTLRIAVK